MKNKIYQFRNGQYLPNCQQPSNDIYEIRSEEYSVHKSTRYVNVVEKIDSLKRILPELYSNRAECCGCAVCEDSCGKKAIIMRPDEEGFLYPIVDASRCVRCYKCISVCPMK